MQSYYKPISTTIIFMDFIIEIVCVFSIVYCKMSLPCVITSSNVLKRLDDFSESFVATGECF